MILPPPDPDAPETVRLWDGDQIAAYQFSHDCTPAVALRHWHLREILQRHGYVPSLGELKAALERRGVAASLKTIRADLAALGWRG